MRVLILLDESLSLNWLNIGYHNKEGTLTRQDKELRLCSATFLDLRRPVAVKPKSSILIL